MQERTTVNDYDSFLRELENQRKLSDSKHDRSFILIFMANDDPETKQSWCSDCAKAKPIIEEAMEDLRHPSIVYVLVGSRDEWKRDNNPFKLHEFKVTNVPTVINLRNNARLVESECFERDKLRGLFNNSV